MRLPSALEHRRASFNMTPMIDVVFLLVVFFLLSSHLARRENQLELPLPTARTGQPDALDHPLLTLNVLADGRLFLAGKSVAADQLLPRLQRAIARLGDQLELRLRADRHTPYDRVEPALQAAAAAGLWNVNVAVLRELTP